MFDLHVRVEQSTTSAFAIGKTVDVCAGGARQQWEATIPVSSQTAFEAGPARSGGDAVSSLKMASPRNTSGARMWNWDSRAVRATFYLPLMQK